MNRNFGDLENIGIVVRHLDRVRDSMESIFGVLPSETAVKNYEGISYRGEIADTAMEVLVYRHFGIELHFIAPLGSENVWDDFLQQHGEGIHHLGFRVADQTAVMLELADQGMSVLQAVDVNAETDGSHAYFDSVPELGFTLETISRESASAPIAELPAESTVARLIPLEPPVEFGSAEPVTLTLVDINRGHTTLRFRTSELTGADGNSGLSQLRMDDGLGTDFGNPVIQRGLPPLEDLVQVSFPGSPDLRATALLISSGTEPYIETSVPLGVIKR